MQQNPITRHSRATGSYLYAFSHLRAAELQTRRRQHREKKRDPRSHLAAVPLRGSAGQRASRETRTHETLSTGRAGQRLSSKYQVNETAVVSPSAAAEA